MITTRFCRFVSWLFPLTAQYGITKYTWCFMKQLFVLPKDNKSNKKMIAFNQISIAIFTKYHIIQTILFYFIGDINLLVFMIACTNTMLAALSCNMLLVLWSDECMATINSMIVLLRHMHSKFQVF